MCSSDLAYQLHQRFLAVDAGVEREEPLVQLIGHMGEADRELVLGREHDATWEVHVSGVGPRPDTLTPSRRDERATSQVHVKVKSSRAPVDA